MYQRIRLFRGILYWFFIWLPKMFKMPTTLSLMFSCSSLFELYFRNFASKLMPIFMSANLLWIHKSKFINNLMFYLLWTLFKLPIKGWLLHFLYWLLLSSIKFMCNIMWFRFLFIRKYYLMQEMLKPMWIVFIITKLSYLWWLRFNPIFWTVYIKLSWWNF